MVARGSGLWLPVRSITTRGTTDALLNTVGPTVFSGDGDITFSYTEEQQSLRKQWICFPTDEAQTSS